MPGPWVLDRGHYKWLKDPVCDRDRDDAEVLNVLHDLHQDDPRLVTGSSKTNSNTRDYLLRESGSLALPDRWASGLREEEGEDRETQPARSTMTWLAFEDDRGGSATGSLQRAQPGSG